MPSDEELGQFWFLSGSVTVLHGGGTFGNGYMQAPDGSRVHVDWETPGDYCFEQSAESRAPVVVDNPSMTMDSIRRYNSDFVEAVMPGLWEKWQAWKDSLSN